MVRGILPLLLAGLLPALAAATPAGPAPIHDEWLAAGGEMGVRTAACGTNLCATVVWVRVPGRDSKNAVAALRGRDLVGIKLFDMKPVGGGAYSGQLYEPRSGRSYAGSVRLEGADALAVTGCLQEHIACQTARWPRAR